ncbi:MAG TPA: hypothetical protein IGR64_15665 [Leptolyngbyaceae cyanobacterium M65_K2018_010]|nr:hypothetical protein [Leptolyngbyaceae cyanobacterium M65_K2018_010]
MTDPQFSPGQIVYLVCEQTRLYAQVIQVLVDRGLGWVRPLVLVTPTQTLVLEGSLALGHPHPPTLGLGPKVPDLLWPLEQFYPALDTEFLELLATAPRLSPSEWEGLAADISPRLHRFVNQLWQAQTTSLATEAGLPLDYSYPKDA